MGSGIPRQYVHRIFEKFFRAPGQSGGGSGLGLALSKDIVEAHGGQIRAGCPDGGGTIVCFALRRADRAGAVPLPNPAVAEHTPIV